jgi:large subunit ribosomal protein L25
MIYGCRYHATDYEPCWNAFGIKNKIKNADERFAFFLVYLILCPKLEIIKNICLSSNFEILFFIHLSMHTLEAKIRTETARDTRENGAIPAVLYGKDVPSTSVMIHVSDFTRTFREVGKNHVFTLKVGKDSYSVLIHELQKHPVTGKPLHIDFLTVDLKSVIHVQIPITLVGTSPAVVAWGQVHQTLHALDVKCLPNDVIDSFELDISAITHIGQALHVSDIVINEKKYQLLSHKEEAVALVHAVKEHKIETDSVSVADVGVATEKKKDEETAA